MDLIIISLPNITKHSQGEDGLTLPSLDKLQAWPFKVPKHFVNMLHVHDTVRYNKNSILFSFQCARIYFQFLSIHYTDLSPF